MIAVGLDEIWKESKGFNQHLNAIMGRGLMNQTRMSMR